MEMTKVKLSALFIALFLCWARRLFMQKPRCAGSGKSRCAGRYHHSRRRASFNGDQTEALRASLINKPAKNIILLIGDGMGDSEITAARNYAEGAGGFFKGIDALPLTGQYTHYSLDKKPANRTT
jgi:alkaline phosphatase